MILDASERVGDPWRKRWDSLRLYSPASYDGLPGLRFPAKRTSYPTTHEMADYLEAYASAFRAAGPAGTRPSTRSRSAATATCVTAGDQTFEADNVVVATGVMQEPVRPELRARARSRGSRSSTRTTTATLAAAGRRRARRRGEPLGRGHRVRGRRASTTRSFRASTTGRSRCGSTRAAGAWAFACCSSPARTSSRWTRRWAARCARTCGTAALRSSVTGGRIFAPPVSTGRSRGRSASRTAGRCSTTAAFVDVQNVVWCTGFRPDFSWIDVPFDMGDDGYPVQYRGVVDSAPGLYFVGLLFLHSFTSMLIYGTGGMPSGSRSTSRHRRRPSWRGRRLLLRSPSRSPREGRAPRMGLEVDERVGPSELLVWNGAVTRVTRIGVLPRKERSAAGPTIRAPEGRPFRKRDPPIA